MSEETAAQSETTSAPTFDPRKFFFTTRIVNDGAARAIHQRTVVGGPPPEDWAEFAIPVQVHRQLGPMTASPTALIPLVGCASVEEAFEAIDKVLAETVPALEQAADQQLIDVMDKQSRRIVRPPVGRLVEAVR